MFISLPRILFFEKDKNEFVVVVFLNSENNIFRNNLTSVIHCHLNRTVVKIKICEQKEKDLKN